MRPAIDQSAIAGRTGESSFSQSVDYVLPTTGFVMFSSGPEPGKASPKATPSREGNLLARVVIEFCRAIIFTIEVSYLVAVEIAFAAGRLEIEYEILHVEPQLSERFLNKLQDFASACCAFNDPIQGGSKLNFLSGRQSIDYFLQLNQLDWSVLWQVFSGSCSGTHRSLSGVLLNFRVSLAVCFAIAPGLAVWPVLLASVVELVQCTGRAVVPRSPKQD